MKQRIFILNALVFVFFCVGLTSSVKADVQQAFVSVSGRDGAPCSDAHPCRTFAAALAAVAAGGTVIAVDSGEFGPVAITKPVSIIGAPGAHAQITATTADAVTINAGASDLVQLRNLDINGLGAAVNGIAATSVGSLRVDNCILTSLVAGIVFKSAGWLVVNNTISRNNNWGISIGGPSPSGHAYASIDHCSLDHNSIGVEADDFTHTVVSNSVIAANSTDGILAAANLNDMRMTVESSSVFGNAAGIVAFSLLPIGGFIGPKIRVSNTTITQNISGLLPLIAGEIWSRGNNTVIDNGGSEAFTGTFSAK